MAELLVTVGCGGLGLAVGPLVNRVIERAPGRRRVLGPPERCARCGDRPAWWLGARGACRGCDGSIGVRQVLVTGGTAALYAAAAVRFGVDWALPAYLVFFGVLVAVAVIDLEHLLVPNRIVSAALAASLPLLGLAAGAGGDWARLGTALVGSLAGGSGLFVVHLVHPRGMGMGDVKLALVLGLFLGWLGLAHVALGLFLGFLLGAVGGLAAVGLGQRRAADHVPFAPFLAAGAVLAVLAGDPLLDWYLGS